MSDERQALEPEERTARIRARAGAARPRVTYREIAEEAGYKHSYTAALLSDNANTNDLSDALTALEGALDLILAARQKQAA